MKNRMNINKLKTGQLIAERRRNMNMTQSELAEKLHISAKAVSKWERAQNFPGVDMLKDLAEVLEVHIEDLVDGEIIGAVSSMENNNDLASIYLKNCQYMNYLKIMDLQDAKEGLLLNCILNDYYNRYPTEMDNAYKKEYEIIKAYKNLIRRNNPNIFLALQNDLLVASNVINRGLYDNESIDEAKFNVSSVEFKMVLLLTEEKYDIRSFDSEQKRMCDQIFKYMLIRCEMQKYINIFNTCDLIRSYKKVLTEMHSNHYDLIDKHLEDDFVIYNKKYVFVEDYNKADIINKFKGAIKFIEYEIYQALNAKKFDDKKILSALDEMGLYAAMLTKYDALEK